MDQIRRLQKWFASQCNEDWEHQHGVRIETLDNPGWWVRIDLRNTLLEDSPFTGVSRGNSEFDASWIDCKVQDEEFRGTGGAENLFELLQIFLDWAEAQ